MGGSPYWYVVPHEDPASALQKLRVREFKAGRYNPVIRMPRFPVTEKSPAPGAKHATIEKALKASDADGTRSILDIQKISEVPEFLAASPMTEEAMARLFKTTRPTREMVLDDLMARMHFFAEIPRGHAVYLSLYKNSAAVELLFAGYSVD